MMIVPIQLPIENQMFDLIIISRNDDFFIFFKFYLACWRVVWIATSESAILAANHKISHIITDLKYEKIRLQ